MSGEVRNITPARRRVTITLEQADLDLLDKCKKATAARAAHSDAKG